MEAPAPGPEWHELPLLHQTAIGPGDLGRFLFAFVRTMVGFAGRSFGGIIARAQRDTALPRPSKLDPAAYAREVYVFDILCLWLPARIQCLFRSLLLLHFLRSKRLDADWVFGVQIYPFRAHCWLAIDTLLIGERTHRILPYRPILTIRRSRP